MKAIVCGGRNQADEDRVWRGLTYFTETFGPLASIAHGGATGVDTFAGEWAKRSGVRVSVYPARWRAEGKAAGPRRNQRMLDEFKPDVVIAFAGGRGTADMVRRAEAEGVRIHRL